MWRKSERLALEVYRATGTGDFAKDFALRDQIRRAAVSVMSNIAEGFERYSRTEFRHFLAIARGSVAEVRSQLHLARGLGYLSATEFETLYEASLEISRMLAALRASAEKS